MTGKYQAGAAIVTVAILAALVIGAMTFTQVQEGTVEVKKHHGEATGEALGPGLHYPIWPLVQTTVEVPTRPQTYTMSGDPWEGDSDEVDSIELMSADQQQVNVDVTVRYRVPAEHAVEFYSEWRDIGTANERLVRPTVESTVQERASSMNATEANSDEGRAALAEDIKESLEEETGSEVRVEHVAVRDVHLDPGYQAELERVEMERQIAEQRIIEAESRAEADAIRDSELTRAVLTESYIEAIDESTTVVLATDEDGVPVIIDLEDSSEGGPEPVGSPLQNATSEGGD